MKIIDLLNKIANGEEVPKRIIYDEYVYKLSEDRENYENEIDPLTTLDWNYIAMNCLNEEVEILNKSLKEEKKIPEKLDISGGISVVNCAYKINEIIDYLKSKGE